MRETTASFIATSVAGLTAAALFAAYVIVMEANYPGPGSLFGYVLAMVFPFEVVSFLLGWPSYVVASSFGRARWWVALLVGFALGGLFAPLLPVTSWLAFPIIGAMAGGAFWVTLRSLSPATQ